MAHIRAPLRWWRRRWLRAAPGQLAAWTLLFAAVMVPLLGSTFYVRLAIEALLVGLLAMSIGILLGFAGLLSLGQAGFFGLAAYISALMFLNVSSSFWLVLLTVLGATTLFATVLGVVAIRTRGVYFALITFGFGEILFKIVSHSSAIGGSDGLLGIPIVTIGIGPLEFSLADNVAFFYFVLGLLTVIYLGIGRLLATPFGLVLRGLHENESRVAYLAYNPLVYRLAAFVLAANVAAIGGMMYPPLRGFVGPNLFAFELSVKAVVMSLVGGVGTLVGPLIGGVLITFLDSIISTFIAHHSLVVGALFVACVLFFPGGLAGVLQSGLADRSPTRRDK